MDLLAFFIWAGGVAAYSGTDPRGFWGAVFWPWTLGKAAARWAQERAREGE